MSLEKIRLPAEVLASLYRNTLVSGKNDPARTEAASSRVATKSRPVLRYLGNNRKKVTLVLESRNASFLEDHHLSFLTRILEACKMNLGDVAIINHAASPVTISEVSRELSPGTILLFGLEPTAIKLPFLIPLFKIQEHDHRRFLCAPGLDELNQDSEEGRILKSKLWVCLRTLFEV